MEISRGQLLTFQEHCLLGSTLGKDYSNNPYRPIGVIESKIPAEECHKLRQDKESGKLWNVLVNKWGVRGDYGIATLESLDLDKSSATYGNTKDDPILIEVFQEQSPTLRDMEFPYKRSELRINTSQ